MLSVCLHDSSAVFAPPPTEEQPKKSYFSAQNRFLATTGAVVATPVALALREAAQKACAQTPKNKDKKKYYQELTKNFYKNIATIELWKCHFLRLHAVIACFSKREKKETHRAWALRTKKSLTLYAKQNPVHAAVLALWTVNFVGTTLHIGYTTTRATTEAIKQWMQAFTLDPHKKPKESSTPLPIELDFAQHPEGAAEESTDAPAATPQASGGKLQRAKQKIAEFIPVTTGVNAYFSTENREHAREDVRAWLKALQTNPLGSHVLAGTAQLTHPTWYTHLAAIPVHILTQLDPQDDVHVDWVLGCAHAATLLGTLPADLAIGTVKGTFYAGKCVVYDAPLACGSRSKRGATRAWNAFRTSIGFKPKND